ncbi:hypothetical protein PQX77_020178 [Marasmius sp. AFHP31]|nr:hypothetical protein PQX77_020178 [Marasmius sp. AFHP31]
MSTYDFDWFRYAEPNASINIKVESHIDPFPLSPPSSPSPAFSSSSSSSSSPPSLSTFNNPLRSRLRSPKRASPYPLTRNDPSTMSYTPYPASRTSLRAMDRRSSDGDESTVYHQHGMSNTNYPSPVPTSFGGARTIMDSWHQNSSSSMSNTYQDVSYMPHPEASEYSPSINPLSNSPVDYYSLVPPSTPHPSTRANSDVHSLHYRIRVLEETQRQDKEKIRQLEAQLASSSTLTPPGSAGNTPPSSASFESSWRTRTAARKRQFCSPNRAGNALCAWHDTRRERRAFPPRNAPAGYLNCGCSDEEALFEESLARNGVGSYLPGDTVRMDPALRNPLLRLLQRRYGYRDGDFERDARSGDWISGEGPGKWEQESNASIRRPRNDRR